jgi:hypothetical protein
LFFAYLPKYDLFYSLLTLPTSAAETVQSFNGIYLAAGKSKSKSKIAFIPQSRLCNMYLHGIGENNI